MELAYQSDSCALIPCGYKKTNKNGVTETWVDLHFSYYGKMKVVDALLLKTQPMCVAINKKYSAINNIALHPATEAFVDLFFPFAKRYFTENKPEAVRLAASGECSACIGSVDVVKQYSNLKILKRFNPQMMWAVHSRVT